VTIAEHPFASKARTGTAPRLTAANRDPSDLCHENGKAAFRQLTVSLSCIMRPTRSCGRPASLKVIYGEVSAECPMCLRWRPMGAVWRCQGAARRSSLSQFGILHCSTPPGSNFEVGSWRFVVHHKNHEYDSHFQPGLMA